MNFDCYQKRSHLPAIDSVDNLIAAEASLTEAIEDAEFEAR